MKASIGRHNERQRTLEPIRAGYGPGLEDQLWAAMVTPHDPSAPATTHMDQGMRGRMLAGIDLLLMDDEPRRALLTSKYRITELRHPRGLSGGLRGSRIRAAAQIPQ